MTDFSIAIVAYNNEEDVRRAVESIERCTPSVCSKEIFIIDNSTEPNTIYALMDKYTDVRYIMTGKNIGFGAGHNYVMQYLESKYHAIVNPDIILKEDAFSKIKDFMDSEECGMCVPRITDEAGELLKVYRRKVTVFDMFIRMFFKSGFKKRQAYHTMQDMDYEKPFEVPFAQGSFLVIKTELFMTMGGFDERFFLYMEDVDLCRRVSRLAKILYCPNATVIHKWERGSHKNPKLFLMHVKSMIKYFNKWGLQ